MDQRSRTRILVSKNGAVVKAIYSDATASLLSGLGQLKVTRASHVEPGHILKPEAVLKIDSTFLVDGKLKPELHNSWFADLSPVGGPTLGPFDTHAAAIAAEIEWLTKNYYHFVNKSNDNDN